LNYTGKRGKSQRASRGSGGKRSGIKEEEENSVYPSTNELPHPSFSIWYYGNNDYFETTPHRSMLVSYPVANQ
jgi:hypothetical protein